MKPITIAIIALLGLGHLAYAQQGGPPSPPPSNQGNGNGNGNGRPDHANDVLDEVRDALDKDTLDEQRKSYEAERKSLRDALKAELEALGRGAKRDEVNDVVARFKEKNAGLIEAQRDVAEALKNAAKEAQMAGRNELPEAIKGMKTVLDKSKANRKASKDAFRKALENAKTDEKKRELFDEHLAEQKDHHKQVRDDLKKFREELRNRRIEEDRRPGE